ncbi:MAG TPA: serine hydrolase domain-containing protein, partial [Acidimicrobiales bacterium]
LSGVPTDRRTLTSVLKDHIERGAASGRFAGLVGAVVAGEEILIEAARNASAKPGSAAAPGPDTILEIGSVTKLFTALALSAQAHRRRVDLNQPVRSLLPPGVDVRSGAWHEASLQHLATHTSGLPRLPKGFFLRSLHRLDDPYADFEVPDLYASLSRTRLRSRPGTRFHYSNLGMGLLGHALSRNEGVDYGELVGTLICAPLGLRDTGVSLAPDQEARFIQGHDRRGRATGPWHIPALAGAGALLSTPSDLARFLQVQLAPDRAGAEGLEEAIRATQAERFSGRRTGVGLGWLISPFGTGGTLRWHNGRTGGYSAFLGMTSLAGVAVLANSARSVDGIGTELLRAVTEMSQ